MKSYKTKAYLKEEEELVAFLQRLKDEAHPVFHVKELASLLMDEGYRKIGLPTGDRVKREEG